MCGFDVHCKRSRRYFEGSSRYGGTWCDAWSRQEFRNIVESPLTDVRQRGVRFEYSSEEEELDDEEVVRKPILRIPSQFWERSERAIKGFHTIVETEKQPGTWVLKRSKIVQNILFASKTEKIISSYEALLELAKCNAVTRAVAEKGVNSILNKIFSIESAQTENSSVHAKTTGQMFEKIYKLTLDATRNHQKLSFVGQNNT